jgi:CubicO group peptidase (beta-lactamase class C family)
MHFRNGAVAISYMSTLLLQLVDQKKITLNDKLSEWLPDLPGADRVSLRMLSNMTAGYSDYVADEQFIKALYMDPFRQFAPQELIAIGTSKSQVFEPGTNWDYSHTNYVILGQALEKIAKKPMATIMQDNIIGPLGLKDTDSPATAAIREPVLHAFSSERREALGIAPARRFYEESTYWNPSWTLAQGAIQTTNIYDMSTTAIAVGTGSLLSPESHQAQVGASLLGFGHPAPGCRSCHTLDRSYSYGLGVVLKGSWILQNPSFGGYSAVEAYLPSKEIAVAVAATFGEKSFDEEGGIRNYSDELFATIGAYLAPDDPPPPAARK